MTCSNCERWKQQAQANARTVLLQAEVIKGLRFAIQEIVAALKERR